MSLQVIYIARHGFRSNWLVDPSTGDYQAMVRSPTGIAADPALTSHGVEQARELAVHLAVRGAGAGIGTDADADIEGAGPAGRAVERIYCSPYYRCLQTVQPFVEGAGEGAGEGADEDGAGGGVGQAEEADKRPPRAVLAVRCEPGLADWFGPAPFPHPHPAPVATLRTRFFPWIDDTYVPSGLAAPRQGETMAQLHARVAACLEHIVRQCDRDGVRAVLVCSHAAPIIAMGRALTGRLPVDVEAEDFGVFTCGLSVFRRRAQAAAHETTETALPWDHQGQLAGLPWTRSGVSGGWDCEVNCDCSFLHDGAERGWRFSGDDEAFVGHQQRPQHSILDAGLALGVVVQGRRSDGQSQGARRDGQPEPQASRQKPRL